MQTKQSRTVAILFGGIGAERAVSEKSAAYLLSAIDRNTYLPLPVGIDRTGRWFLYTGALSRIADGSWRTDLCRLTETFPIRRGSERGFLTPDGVRSVFSVVPVLHGDGGEDGSIQGLLEAAGIPYVGCNATASAIGIDKLAAKAIAASRGIPTLPSVLLSRDRVTAKQQAATLGYPLFIKPARLGSSVGCIAVLRAEDFDAAYAEARAASERLLAEPYLAEKRELECAYFCDGEVVIPPPGEVRSDGVYTFLQKYGEKSTAKTDVAADLPKPIADTVISYTRTLAEAIGVRHLSRFDYFLTKTGILFNEINTFPGMTPASLYPKMLTAAGIPPTEMLSRLIGASV